MPQKLLILLLVGEGGGGMHAHTHTHMMERPTHRATQPINATRMWIGKKSLLNQSLPTQPGFPPPKKIGTKNAAVCSARGGISTYNA